MLNNKKTKTHTKKCNDVVLSELFPHAFNYVFSSSPFCREFHPKQTISVHTGAESLIVKSFLILPLSFITDVFSVHFIVFLFSVYLDPL